MKTVTYCTIDLNGKLRTNDIHKKIDKIYKQPDDHTPCPRWSANGTMVDVVSELPPVHSDEVSSIHEVNVPTGELVISFQYPAIRRKDGHLKVYDSAQIAKDRISEKVTSRLTSMGFSDVNILEYHHNIARIDLSDRTHGVSKLPVSFIVAKVTCNDEDVVKQLMVDGLGKFRFAGLGMVYVTGAGSLT